MKMTSTERWMSISTAAISLGSLGSAIRLFVAGGWFFGIVSMAIFVVAGWFSFGFWRVG